MKSVMEIYSGLAKENQPWTDEEEKAFIKKWWKKDREYFVREALLHNLSLVFDIVNKTAFKKNDEDTFQKALIALTLALRKFKPSKNVKISTWVAKPVKWSVLQTQHASSNFGTIAETISAKNHQKGTNWKLVSVDAPVGNSDESIETIANTITASNVAPDYASIRGLRTPEEEARENDIRSGVSAIFAKMGKVLNKQEMQVIRGLLAGHNQSEISVTMKVSRMRISQIIAKAFAKIRESDAAPALKELLG